MKRLAGLLVPVLAFPALAADPPRFVDETKAAGIDSVYDGDFVFMAGAGVAAFDCSGDGKPELFFAGGTNTAKLYRNRSEPGGSLAFEPAADSGLDLEAVTGAYPLDIDGDGKVDLAVLRVGENLLMRGKGNCRFERANEAWGFDGGNTWTTAFSATWENGNAWPTLVVGNFMKPETVIMGYGDCDSSLLYRPKTGGRYGKPRTLAPAHCTLSMLFSDWNRDGVQDLRVSNDKEFYTRGEEQLFRLTADGARAYAREEGWNKVNIWGMGIASRDVTGDGYPDYYLTNMTDNRFEVLADGATRPDYRDRAKDLGLAAGFPFMGGDRKPSTAWHAEFGDVNNDTLADLLVVKGNVETVRFVADVDPNNLLIGQSDGTFREGAKKAGVVDFELGRGGALVDLNGDGRLDMVVTHRYKPATVWRNLGQETQRHWLDVSLEQTGGNRSAVGAWVEVRTPGRVQRQEHTVGGGHAGGQWGPLHFGLGTAQRAEVRVQWPGGAWGPWRTVPADRTVRMAREKS